MDCHAGDPARGGDQRDGGENRGGGSFTARINAAETEDELGRLAGVLNSTFARLEAAFAQQGRFASDVAHELRTPVSVMLTQTQTALKSERSAAEYRQTVESCQRAAQRMRRLIESSLLELARLDAGQEPMKRLAFDLAYTAHDCVELVRPLAAERGVTIRCDLPAAVCTGDAERLGQVITNLLTNAIQYNREQGEVRVATEQKNGTVTLTVADTGQGISTEDLPRVFERFYRADQCADERGGAFGAGIGDFQGDCGGARGDAGGRRGCGGAGGGVYGEAAGGDN